MYKIEVRKSDMKAKYKSEPCQCPVAKAFLRAGFEFTDWIDGVNGTWFDGINPQGVRVSLLLPQKVQKWISKFDKTENKEALKKLKPITFSVR